MSYMTSMTSYFSLHKQRLKCGKLPDHAGVAWFGRRLRQMSVGHAQMAACMPLTDHRSSRVADVTTTTSDDRLSSSVLDGSQLFVTVARRIVGRLSTCRRSVAVCNYYQKITNKQTNE